MQIRPVGIILTFLFFSIKIGASEALMAFIGQTIGTIELVDSTLSMGRLKIQNEYWAGPGEDKQA